ncbi:hypothetical protein BU26DRAFT_558110 [Trematosphaeria pertusa]|uniref:BTB domain-containing protein n=1 Tax=Trematosphaeria pertusa TaxID=390896 RepID=A0A6A6J1X4_9PLEO|nr:uncharacterized protein BU26DRAFT_558110 [Trematosphaeria pertusa]KAF2256666.1 hypothetical protein BU26DRAFT_558110 [Trematosphaeria pertusa]
MAASTPPSPQGAIGIRSSSHLDLYTGPTIRVKVGLQDQEKVFHIHKELTMRHSNFFRKAFEAPDPKVGKHDTDTLPHVTLAAFAMFADWLYKQDLPRLGKWQTAYCTPGNWHAVCWLLTELYYFAGRFGVPQLQSLVKRRAVTYFNTDNLPQSSTITIVHALEKLLQDDIFVRLLADACCKNWNLHEHGAGGEYDFDRLPRSFVLMMMERAGELASGTRLDPDGYEERSEEQRRSVDAGGEPPRKVLKIKLAS